MISAIAAIDEKRGLGKSNDLLFKIPEDLKRFRELTDGHPIVMGRKTYQSIGRTLPNRLNIIVTRHPMNLTFEKDDTNVAIVTSLHEAISLAEERIRTTQYKLHATDENFIFIIGGGEIFKEALPLTDRLYLTIVKGDYSADTFFPEYEKEFTRVLENKTFQKDGYTYTFLTLER